jgi:hypothetical protein
MDYILQTLVELREIHTKKLELNRSMANGSNSSREKYYSRFMGVLNSREQLLEKRLLDFGATGRVCIVSYKLGDLAQSMLLYEVPDAEVENLLRIKLRAAMQSRIDLKDISFIQIPLGKALSTNPFL